MNKYLQGIDAITGASRTVARVADVLGAGAPSHGLVHVGGPVGDFLTRTRAEVTPHDVRDGIGTIVGAAAGALFWHDHRVLGIIGGASLGRNMSALLSPAQRSSALYNMGVTAAGIFGALSIPQHGVDRPTPSRRMLGFALGWLAANTALHVSKLR